MGPLVGQQGLDKIAGMVARARDDGAEVLLGGGIAPQDKGYHYLPTVLVNCRHEMEIMRAEIFGPVLPIQVVDSLDEAIACSNDSDFGLTSSIFTRDLKEAMHACNALQFGETYVNREHFEAMQGFHAGRRHSGIGGADGKRPARIHRDPGGVYAARLITGDGPPWAPTPPLGGCVRAAAVFPPKPAFAAASGNSLDSGRLGTYHSSIHRKNYNGHGCGQCSQVGRPQ